jgi:hypothetical protein
MKLLPQREDAIQRAVCEHLEVRGAAGVFAFHTAGFCHGLDAALAVLEGGWGATRRYDIRLSENER